MITKQEILNDLTQTVDKLILRAVSENRSIYIIELKIFKNTRLNQSTDYTEHALRQCYNDLMVLLLKLDSVMFAPEIEWLNEKVMTM